MFDSVFRNKTVFVTGHTGFQGSWLSLWLHLLGAKVVGYSLDPPTKPSLFNALHLEEQINHIIGDIRDAKHFHESLIKSKPKFVFHLAAQPLVLMSYNNPKDTFSTNIMGTVNLLESIKKLTNLKACIVYTSDKCYANKGSMYAYKETDALGGNDPYSASKAAVELVTNAYRNSYFNMNEQDFGLGTARAGNVIGGGDWAKDRLIPDCVRAIISNKLIKIRNPNAVRPWQFVLEPLSGILCLATKMSKDIKKYSSAWNFGPNIVNNNMRVKKIVEKIIKNWHGKWADYSDKSTNKKLEESYLSIDSSKAKSLLHWTNNYSIDETINETIKWYKEFYRNKSRIKNFTIKQIDNYVRKAKDNNQWWIN